MVIVGKIFKWAVFSILGLFGLAVVASVVIAVLGITLNLNSIRPVVEKAVSTALDRNARITGSVTLKPTLNPTLEIKGVRIDNPEGWSDPVFAAIDLARIQIGLVSLVKKQIDVGEITCENVTLNLETSKQGVNNWDFGSSTTSDPEPKVQASTEPVGIDLLAMDKLSLQQVTVKYRDNNLEKSVAFRLDELGGTGKKGQPLKLAGKGSFQKQSYSFELEAGALEDFHPRLQLYPLTLTGKVAGSPFTARGIFGKDNNESQLDLEMTLSGVDIGALLDWMKVAEGIDAKTDELSLELRLRGKNLLELVTESNVIFTVKGGSYILHGAGRGDGIPIAIDKGRVSSLSGKPVALTLDGKIDTTPITIKIRGMELINYVQNPGQLPIFIDVDAAGTTLDFKGKLAMPVSTGNVTLGMTLKGEKLDSLNKLLQLDLPPLGPYSVGAQFAMSGKGYDLSNLRVKIGSSDLAGNMNINMGGDKPEVGVEFVSKVLQIDDFDMGDWSPEGEKDPAEKPEAVTGEVGAEKKENQEEDKAASLLSPEALSKANAKLLVKLGKVMSGKDALGAGHLKVTLQDGRFSIDPLELELAGGVARTEFSYFPTAEAAEIHLASTINGLDIGIPARRIKPETKMGGQLYLDILLDATAPDLNGLLANGRGHFDLGFAPENFDAGLVDMWAVNLIASLASETDSEPSSVINCVVASFGLDDGIMQERTIFMDTTHMSIEGEATINFKTRELSLLAGPKAKRPEFFSLATPIRMSGKLDDFGVKISVIRLTGTVVSFVTSPVHVPLRRIFTNEIPEDGKEACLEAWSKRNIEE